MNVVPHFKPGCVRIAPAGPIKAVRRVDHFAARRQGGVLPCNVLSPLARVFLLHPGVNLHGPISFAQQFVGGNRSKDNVDHVSARRADVSRNIAANLELQTTRINVDAKSTNVFVRGDEMLCEVLADVRVGQGNYPEMFRIVSRKPRNFEHARDVHHVNQFVLLPRDGSRFGDRIVPKHSRSQHAVDVQILVVFKQL